MSEQQRIAEDATFQIGCAMDHINWLRGVLHVLRDHLKLETGGEHYSTVADLAIYNADDWHNQLDVERQELEARTDKAFPAEGGGTQ
ncbi:hypothetical protein [Pseudomonas chlororaphis]|uniref:hypothetical protein n=1 Tax=Pseudomonas chlororaphis TaxID=587753 RepID=UPI001B303528|nr:hypothetical protein [Pseudomonas chlororaphis]MBP5054347.1 hypothetical protein [Pseudomonas chlororaphis]MBP5140285.1 hypothetical protein [Pseudomonas chlororaphis]QTT99524.1 hypothetical protein HUT26_09645 [Pseudomonas chlororaphis]